MNSVDRDKLTRIKNKLEQRVSANRREAVKMKGSPENSQYYIGARDEADKILKMFLIEFNNELRVVNVTTTDGVL